MIERLRLELAGHVEEPYRKFQSALLPGVDDLMGVRMGKLRSMAKTIADDERNIDLLLRTPPQSFEENMLCALLIATAKLPCTRKLELVKAFVPRIDNWSICDSFCTSLKSLRDDRESTLAFLQPYLSSSKEYEVRFGVVMLLFHFVCADYLACSLELLGRAWTDAYYARMAVAWATQTYYAAFPREVEAWMFSGALDDKTLKLAVQKIGQSLQTPKEESRRLSQRFTDRTKAASASY